MEEDAVGNDDGARRAASLRIMLLAQLPPLLMALLASVAAIFICVRVVGVWPTVVIWCLLLGLLGSAVIKVLRLRRRLQLRVDCDQRGRPESHRWRPSFGP
jgi:uncharacterized membrane protein